MRISYRKVKKEDWCGKHESALQKFDAEFNKRYFEEYDLPLDNMDIKCVRDEVQRKATVPYAAYSGEEVIGIVLASWDGFSLRHSVGIYCLWVDPEHRRKGVATSLVKHMFRDLCRYGRARYRHFRIVCDVKNGPALALFEKLGMLSTPYETTYDVTEAVRQFDEKY